MHVNSEVGIDNLNRCRSVVWKSLIRTHDTPLRISLLQAVHAASQASTLHQRRPSTPGLLQSHTLMALQANGKLSRDASQMQYAG